jgi:hypothetical protein
LKSPKKVSVLTLVGLLILWQPLAAHEQDVQAQLKDLRDLLAQQQEAAPQTADERNQALLKQVLADPSNTIYDPDFIGAWYLPGTTAAMKVGVRYRF